MMTSSFYCFSFVVTKLWCAVFYTYVVGQILILLIGALFESVSFRGFNIVYIFPIVFACFVLFMIYRHRSKTPKFWSKQKLADGHIFFIVAMLLVLSVLMSIAINGEAELAPITLAVLILSIIGDVMLWRRRRM